MIDYTSLKKTFEEKTFFDGKSWILSGEAFALSNKLTHELNSIGEACLAFYKALNVLYIRSIKNESLLRNKNLKAPWVAEYLDQGKPNFLKEHSLTKHLKQSIPSVIRPDILITDEGLIITELDSVPGGIGLTAFLSQYYSQSETDILGTDMVNQFYTTLSELIKDKKDPVIAIAVSDESESYRPEFEWLAKQLQTLGKKVFCTDPNLIKEKNDKLYIKNKETIGPIDIIYRFFELFDYNNIKTLSIIQKAVECKSVILTPPMKPYQEEKLAFGLFHHFLLEDFWKEQLGQATLNRLLKHIPKTWILDPVELPPNAILNAPTIKGRPIHNWSQIAEASGAERNLILKMSGFHELAWGSRSITLGSDVSQEEWKNAIEHGLSPANGSYTILQNYHKPKQLEHSVYNENGRLTDMHCRVRLCPYYFIRDNKAHLSGILGTLCPSDKKIIHGMKDAVMIPCKAVKHERRTDTITKIYSE